MLNIDFNYIEVTLKLSKKNVKSQEKVKLFLKFNIFACSIINYKHSRVGSIWLFGFCKTLACVSGKGQCAKGAVAIFFFVFMQQKFHFHSVVVFSFRLACNSFIAVIKVHKSNTRWLGLCTFCCYITSIYKRLQTPINIYIYL